MPIAYCLFCLLPKPPHSLGRDGVMPDPSLTAKCGTADMTPNTILLGLGAGLISAIVFVSATTGPVLARFAFFFLTPISLYLAGLGLGPLAAAVAAATATVIMLLIASPAAALVRRPPRRPD